ncbi:hypothetical protein COA23_24290 [Priestia megaterium]|nr:hypothetical protein COA23_24290 [Priestia megaterium]
MFKSCTWGDEMIVIQTKEELKRAKKEKLKEFEVIGPLAEKMKKAQDIGNLSKSAVSALGKARSTNFFISRKSSSSAAVSKIVTPGVFIAAISIGGVLIAYALFKDYEVEFEVGPDGVKVKMKRK